MQHIPRSDLAGFGYSFVRTEAKCSVSLPFQEMMRGTMAEALCSTARRHGV
jgi:hypothetical protein